MELKKEQYVVSKETLEKVFGALRNQGASIRRVLEAEDALVFEVGNQHLSDEENAQNQ